MTSHHHPMCDVAILGGGVIGLSIAYELSLRGHQVHVIDREAIDLTADENQTLFPRRTSSWAAAGILPAASLEAVTDPMDRLRGLSHQLYPRFCRRVEEESRIDTHFERSGGMYLSSTAGETASMVGMVAYWRDLEIECEEISSQDLCVRESRLSSWVERHELARAWFVPDEYQIHPPSLLRALGVACAGRGVNLVGNTVVVDIDECGTSIAVECEGEVQDLQADRVVVCGGVGIGKMSDRLALNQSVVPVRGQMLLLRQADHGLRS
ncbi:MAG: FAD-dependent oxidoreductase, partial [Planctomycetota bacterium]